MKACLERTTRFELATLALARRCSTTEPRPHKLVRVEGIEPPRRETLDPKSSASANSATPACELKDNFKMAGAVGIEPTLTVLETVVLPLNYAPIKSSSHDGN